MLVGSTVGSKVYRSKGHVSFHYPAMPMNTRIHLYVSTAIWMNPTVVLTTHDKYYII